MTTNSTITRYPSILDYKSSIENPSKFILDPALQSARAKVNPFSGEPLHWAGGYAHVYVMQCPSGEKYALRCWTSDVGDSDRRYQAVSSTLAELRLPHFVDFEYVPEGILVNGGKYPVLRMGWVEGDSLSEFISENLGQPVMMWEAADAFLALCQNLHLHGIAHGDLQSENMKVCTTNIGRIELVLIDYDTLYVPSLAGSPVKNAGLPAYQHPLRAEAETASGKDDYFSELVIYLSLLALAEDPQIWELVPEDQHDKELLFTAADFSAAFPSPIFRRMRKLSPYVSRLALVLWNFTRCRDVSWLIPLETVVQICTEEPAAVPVGAGAGLEDSETRFDYLLMEQVTGQATAGTDGIGAPDSSWLVEWKIGPPGETALDVGRPAQPTTQSLSRFEDLLGPPSNRSTRPVLVTIPPLNYPAYPPASPQPTSSGRGVAFFIAFVLVAGAIFLIWLMASAPAPQIEPAKVTQPPTPVLPPLAPVAIAPPAPPHIEAALPVILPPAGVPIEQEISNFLTAYFLASSGTPEQEMCYFDESTPTIPYFDKQMSRSEIQANTQAFDDQHPYRIFRYAGGTYRTIDANTYQVTGQVDYNVSNPGGGAPQVGRVTDLITLRRISGQLKIVSFESALH